MPADDCQRQVGNRDGDRAANQQRTPRIPIAARGQRGDAAHEGRRQQVILLLDAERPGVQQRIDLGLRREIVAGRREVIVRDHRRGRSGRLRQVVALLRQHGKQRRERQSDHGDQQQRRQDAQNPPRVEIGRREAAGQQLADDLMRDQESGDDEEHVDADKSAAKARNVGVKADHRDDRDGPHAVDIGEPSPRRKIPIGGGGRLSCRYRFGRHAAIGVVRRRPYQGIAGRRRGAIKAARECTWRFF